MTNLDIFNVTSDQLKNSVDLEKLYIEAVKAGLCENNQYSVLEFFMLARVALTNDQHNTPEKLFFFLLKDNEKRYFTDSLEYDVEKNLPFDERCRIANMAHEACMPAKNTSEEEKSENLVYASEGALTWQELLRNTALLAAGENGAKQVRSSSRNFRKYDDDAQGTLDFMASTMVDVYYKDDTSLMDISPFGLARQPRSKPIKYDLKDAHICVTGNAEYGMATIHDYDIVIFIASHLNAQMNELKKRVKAGEKNPKLPPRKLRCYTTDVLDYIKVSKGGKQYRDLKDKLRRLRGTYIEVEKKMQGGFRREGSFSLIGDWEIISETKSGKIAELSLGIPDWIYDGIVRQADPTVLTLCDGYMLLKSGYHKFLARIAKKSAGENSWNWTLEQLYDRSGSSQPIKDFRCDLIKALESLKKDPIPEYHFTWKETGSGRKKGLQVSIRSTGLKGRLTSA